MKVVKIVDSEYRHASDDSDVLALLEDGSYAIGWGLRVGEDTEEHSYSVYHYTDFFLALKSWREKLVDNFRSSGYDSMTEEKAEKTAEERIEALKA